MKHMKPGKGLMILAIIAMVGFGATAHGEDTQTTAPMKGPGYHGKNTPGDCPMMADRDGRRRFHPNLTPEEKEKFDTERTAFREATKDLKQEIYQKHLALMAEMAKKSPSKKTAMQIQKEISDLQAQMAAKRLDHRFNLKAINPELGKGMGRYHQGSMMRKHMKYKDKCPKMSGRM